MTSCRHILVMGVSGSGKTTVASALARELGLEMIEGDDHHPAANVEKMAAGIPLTDEDRLPWLRELADLLADRHAQAVGTVLACSALRRSYRDILRSRIPLHEAFAVELDADPDALLRRLQERAGHFMPAGLLDSQLATLEPLMDDEQGVIVDADMSIDEITRTAAQALRAWSDLTR